MIYYAGLVIDQLIFMFIFVAIKGVTKRSHISGNISEYEISPNVSSNLENEHNLKQSMRLIHFIKKNQNSPRQSTSNAVETESRSSLNPSRNESHDSLMYHYVEKWGREENELR